MTAGPDRGDRRFYSALFLWFAAPFIVGGWLVALTETGTFLLLAGTLMAPAGVLLCPTWKRAVAAVLALAVGWGPPLAFIYLS
jgi:hypothetical protein